MVNKVHIKNKNKNVINIKINTDKGKKKTTKKTKRRPAAPTNGVSSFSYANQPPVVIQYQQPIQTNTPKPDTIREPITNARTLNQQIQQEQEENRYQTNIPTQEDFFPYENPPDIVQENPMLTQENQNRRGRPKGSKNRPKPQAELVELMDVAPIPVMERIQSWEKKTPSKMF